VFENLYEYRSAVGDYVNGDYFAAEETLILELARQAVVHGEKRERIEAFAAQLVESVRTELREASGLDSFLSQYDLSSEEGVALMCLAEALLRVPDSGTADLLIADRLAAGDWSRHLGESESLFVNASTWGLMLTGRLTRPDPQATGNPAAFVHRLAARLGEPIVRAAFLQAMKIMGQQFVMGRDIDEAFDRGASGAGSARDRWSFDMLGEAALTSADAQKYFERYLDAIRRVGARVEPGTALMDGAGVSVKLSALSPRFEFGQRERVHAEVGQRLLDLVVVAREHGVPLTVDAEESQRLELTLAVFTDVFMNRAVGDWNGLGLAVQAYQRRAMRVLDWLEQLAAGAKRAIPVRLVKGAYWDTEIKSAQESGWPSYPVFTRKANTDISYLACVHKLFASDGRLWPQFATHNAHTVAYILEHAPAGRAYEFQRLHGMGEALFDVLAKTSARPVACRVYAPIGRHEDLLPYLVRRLLENGANTSFVNRIVDGQIPARALVRQPEPGDGEPIVNPRIPAPPDLYGAERLNSAGFNLFDGHSLGGLADEMTLAMEREWTAEPLIDGVRQPVEMRDVLSPAHADRVVGRVGFASGAIADLAVDRAVAAVPEWNRIGVKARAKTLQHAADLLEQRRAELIALCIMEAGKCLPDAVAEIREAVDFLRYYANEAVSMMGDAVVLPGPTGEQNTLTLAGRGVFVCISPWNFPVAIFTGQVAAALVTGNSVIAKPAEQTSLVAARVVSLMHEAGIPATVLQFLPGEGAVAGARTISNPAIAGVAFTGSTETATAINRGLAARVGPIGTLIAETGGQNAMVVDSTALPEQVVADVVESAFNSAGQRCSALRVLFVQREIADRVLELLRGHMGELRIGDPARVDTDIGPVIDAAALGLLTAHRTQVIAAGRLIYECPLESGIGRGHYFAPLAVELDDTQLLEREVFGPVLHVLRFDAEQLDEVVATIDRMGYGLTFGIQSRIELRAADLAARMNVGNVYVNRNMIGAVVGTQPFGGQGLSGTGPKAGGPHYLRRFVTEKTVCINTAAVGGNATLLAQD